MNLFHYGVWKGEVNKIIFFFLHKYGTVLKLYELHKFVQICDDRVKEYSY